MLDESFSLANVRCLVCGDCGSIFGGGRVDCIGDGRLWLDKMDKVVIVSVCC